MIKPGCKLGGTETTPLECDGSASLPMRSLPLICPADVDMQYKPWLSISVAPTTGFILFKVILGQEANGKGVEFPC